MFELIGWVFGFFWFVLALLAYAMTPAAAYLAAKLRRKPLILAFDTNNRVRYVVPSEEFSRGFKVKDKGYYIKTPNSAYVDPKGTVIFLVEEEVAVTVPTEVMDALERASSLDKIKEAAGQTRRPKVVFDWLSNLSPEHIATIIAAEREAERRLLGKKFDWSIVVWIGMFLLLAAIAYSVFTGGVDYAKISQAVAEGVARALKTAKDVNAAAKVIRVG